MTDKTSQCSQVHPDKNKNLEEEIEKWLGCKAFPEGTKITPLPKAMEIVRNTAYHFANWQYQQLLKESIETIVIDSEKGFNPIIRLELPWKKGEYHYGDKVKLIILKE